MLAAARRAARPARFPGTQATSANTEAGTRRRTGNEGSRASTSELFHVLPLFLPGVSFGKQRLRGRKGPCKGPYVSPGEVPGVGTAGAAQQRITARASGSGGAALRPCASSRLIYIPDNQTRLTAVVQPPGRFSASARPHLTVQRPVATAAEVIIGGGEQGGGRPPRPRSHAASPSQGRFKATKNAAGTLHQPRLTAFQDRATMAIEAETDLVLQHQSRKPLQGRSAL